MASNVGDMDVFVRSMSARGNLGGLSTATADAVKALDAFGKDKILIETVGAGQNEIDIVGTADTVAVLVTPGSGDNVQMLKAGILEIADVFVVNKADKPGVDRTVQELREMIELRGPGARGTAGHHGPGEGGLFGQETVEDDDEGWTPDVIETVATKGEGVEEVIERFDAHHDFLERRGLLTEQVRDRYAEEIRTLLREDAAGLIEAEIDRQGGIDDLVDAVMAGETDPYTLADQILDPVEAALAERTRPANGN
jgi:LAO/AO transport system kinase